MRTHKAMAALVVAAAVLLAAMSGTGYQAEAHTPLAAAMGGDLAGLSDAAGEATSAGTPLLMKTGMTPGNTVSSDTTNSGKADAARAHYPRAKAYTTRAMDRRADRTERGEPSAHWRLYSRTVTCKDRSYGATTGNNDGPGTTRLGWQGGSHSRVDALHRRALSRPALGG